MSRRGAKRTLITVAATLAMLAARPIAGWAGVFDHLRKESEPPTLTDVARMIDHIQGAILDQGSVVVKQPALLDEAECLGQPVERGFRVAVRE